MGRPKGEPRVIGARQRWRVIAISYDAEGTRKEACEDFESAAAREPALRSEPR